MLAICRYWNFQAASACSSREAFCNQPAVSAAEQLARNRLVLASLPNGQRDARTEGRMYGLPARTATSTRRFQFSLVQFASSQLASARFSSFRFATFRFVSSLSLSRPLPLVTGTMARPPDVPCRLTFCQSFSSAPSLSSLTSQCAALAFRSWRNASRLLTIGVKFTVLQAPFPVPFYHYTTMPT